MKTDAYRIAYEEADAELNDILGKFEQLRARQAQIGKVVDALKSLAFEDRGAAESRQPEWSTR